MNENFNTFKNMIKSGIKEFKIGTKTMFKEFFNKETNKKQRANMWTFARLIIPFITLPISIYGLVTSAPLLLIIAGLMAGFGAVTDYFDGKSARKHGSTTNYGKLLDQISDKIFAGMMGINLLFINPNYVYILLGELLIASVNAGYKIKEPKLDIKSSKLGKIKEWPLFISLALGFLSIINPTLFTISNFSIIITSIIQLLTSLDYIDKNNKEIKDFKKQEKINVINSIDNDEKEKELVLTKEKEQTLLEKYRDLSNLLKKIIDEKEKESIQDINENIKTKKL